MVAQEVQNDVDTCSISEESHFADGFRVCCGMDFSMDTCYDSFIWFTFWGSGHRQYFYSTAGSFQFHRLHVFQSKGCKETPKKERTADKERSELVQGIFQGILVTRKEEKKNKTMSAQIWNCCFLSTSRRPLILSTDGAVVNHDNDPNKMLVSSRR